MSEPAPIELVITSLAAGGDGVGRDDNGRVTFVPRTAPGDRVRVRLVKQTASFARGELVEVVEPGPARVVPPCAAFVAGCGGCQWLHVARPAQLDAKTALVAQALRHLIAAGLVVAPIADPCPPLGWRRRARFHVAGGRIGLYAAGTKRVVPLAHCPQLVPALDAALGEVAARRKPPADGELELLAGYRGDVAVGGGAVAVAFPSPPGKAALPTGSAESIELEPGLWATAAQFAQASAAGNAALIAHVAAAVGAPRGGKHLLELYAGGGNFTRGFAAAGWDVTASDVVAPARALPGVRFERGTAAAVLARLAKSDGQRWHTVVLDPPRAGAADAIAGILAAEPAAIVYVSCDLATLARDAARLVSAGYRAVTAQPIDLMPQTAEVEVVLTLARIA